MLSRKVGCQLVAHGHALAHAQRCPQQHAAPARAGPLGFRRFRHVMCVQASNVGNASNGCSDNSECSDKQWVFRQFGKFRQAMQGIGGEGGIWSANGSRQGGCLMESGGAALRPCWQPARHASTSARCKGE